MTWLVIERDDRNGAVVPADDLIEHVSGHECICRPKWIAVWNDNYQTVLWQFVHHSLDGRESRE